MTLRRGLRLLLGACLLVAVSTRAEELVQRQGDGREVAVVLHGLGRDSDSMRKLGRRLEAGGYRVVRPDYPSTSASIEELVAGLDRALSQCCATAPRIHFVTYSLGGILVRAYLSEHKPAALGRVVMIAPPNGGSEWVDRLGNNGAFEKAYGPVGNALGTDRQSLPNRLGPADFEFGVIAGTAAINPMGALLIPGDDDGTVSVENTKLPGMSDFIAVPHSHTFIMNAPDVATATLRFLATGRFRGAELGDATETD